MLKDLDLKIVYDSSEYNLVKDLMVPLLENSIKYDRGVGFFTSGWIKLAGVGLNSFAENQGVARIVMSPILSERDWEAMVKGKKAQKDLVLMKSLMKATIDIEKTLSEDPLNALSWLIADEVLDIKFAIPKGRLSGGDFHDKFAIFEDSDGDRVAIHGSYNDSVHGTLNGESFSVFKSWEEGQVPYVDNHYKRFLSFWSKENSLFDVYEIPEAVREKIIELRIKERPYNRSFTTKNVNLKQEIVLRDYQKEAISKWEENNYKGIFEMATGTGKTITALSCASKVFEEKGKIALIVLCPYLHLMEQWKKEMLKFGFNPVLCASSNNRWRSDVSLRIQDFNLGNRKNISIIATHATASLQNFQDVISSIKEDPKVLICDEVHGLGSPSSQSALLEGVEFRLGLSATPQRWYDAHGTKRLMDYFRGICFSLPIEKAIGTFLVPYSYQPHIVELSEEEFEEYCKLSSSIGKAFHLDKDIRDNTFLQSLLRKRTNLINNAENKESILRKVLLQDLQKAKNDKEPFCHTLFYCPAGKHNEILKIVSDMGISAREFVYTVSVKDRVEILRQFNKGNLQALVAIKCLDEGVDIPATKLAYIIASTTNPREFVQRRGRILRKSKGKEEAIIHDFIVVPPLGEPNKNSEEKVAILKREMPRFAEFASVASNEFEAKNVVKNILREFDVLYLMSMKPWEIYAENSRELLDMEEEV